MPPSAVAALDLDVVQIRPLSEHRQATHRQATCRPNLMSVGDGVNRRYCPPPGVVEIRRLLTAVLEVLDGRRPVSQLGAVLPRRCQGRLLNATAAGGPGPRVLRSVHVSRTTADVVDLCARVDQGRRSRALTGRMEQRDGRWQFTLLAMV